MKKPKILVVDDKPEDADRVKDLLGEVFEVRSVYQSPKTLDAIDKFKPDIVFLDIQMPEENGLEVLRKIKIFHPELKVIMTTIVKDTSVAVEATKKGAFDYLTKPIELKTVLEKINLAVEESMVEADLDKLKKKIKNLEKKL